MQGKALLLTRRSLETSPNSPVNYSTPNKGGKTVNEITDATQDSTYPAFMDHVDYGYNLGLGLELFRKIQLGGTWTQGIKTTPSTIVGLPTPLTSSNRVFSINLVYLF